jgi:hypothetical protein
MTTPVPLFVAAALAALAVSLTFAWAYALISAISKAA